jgi:predicted alpha-1,2-mannosidase
MKQRRRLVSSLAGLVCLLSLAAASAQTTDDGQSLSSYDSVDPFIGTAGGGNTFPGASLPFGMIQWSPDTGSDAWYDYGKKQIYGFSLTHLSGAGCPLYGDFPVLPWAQELTASPEQDRQRYTQSFDHSAERARPGYYAVTLANGIEVQIAVTDRAGIARFRFPQGTSPGLLINPGGSTNSHPHPNGTPKPARAEDGYLIRIVGNNAVQGRASAGGFCGSPTRYIVYMAAQFQQPFDRTSMWKDDALDPTAHEEQAKHAGAWLGFGSQREVVMKVGLSFVSGENARANLEAEIPGWDFDQVRDAARKTWSGMLDRIPVQGGTSGQRTIFYTGLYHMLLSPNLFSDRNGQYMGFDRQPHALAAGRQHAQYANFSDWDIYRNVIQLQALLEPERVSDMAQSLVNDAEQSGWLPRWPAANDVTYVMGGDSPDILLADACAFGARNFDLRTALRYMIKGATEPGPGPHGESERPYIQDELKLGYVPATDSIDGSRTLEYASDDFAIAQFAKAIGDQGEYAAFVKRAGNWQNLLDPETKWIRPRNADGSWLRGFDPEHSLPKRANAPVSTDQYGFEEGNTWQYSFMIPFNYPRLIQAMGGDSVVVPRLNRFFSKLVCWGEPCFNMANEPDFVVPYAYEYTNEPWKTDDVITRIEEQTFSTKPDGIPGNDDLGATSGVYVWNALGMYPGVPGVGGMFLGTPMFAQATLHLADGRIIEVRRQGPGIYVRSVALDGRPLNQLWLPLSEIPPQKTATLRFEMQTAAPSSTELKSPPDFKP